MKVISTKLSWLSNVAIEKPSWPATRLLVTWSTVRIPKVNMKKNNTIAPKHFQRLHLLFL
jgi:hypothetical protein